MNEVEDAIMRLFDDLKIGEIILDGTMLTLQEKFPTIPAGTLGDYVRGLEADDMIERVDLGYKLKKRGYRYLHP